MLLFYHETCQKVRTAINVVSLHGIHGARLIGANIKRAKPVGTTASLHLTCRPPVVLFVSGKFGRWLPAKCVFGGISTLDVFLAREMQEKQCAGVVNAFHKAHRRSDVSGAMSLTGRRRFNL